LYEKFINHYRQEADVGSISVVRDEKFDIASFLKALDMQIPSNGRDLVYRNFFSVVFEIDNSENVLGLKDILSEAGALMPGGENGPLRKSRPAGILRAAFVPACYSLLHHSSSLTTYWKQLSRTAARPSKSTLGSSLPGLSLRA
jgi:hypothetical protein